MLPAGVNELIRGLNKRQDALIAELYVGKITFGEYNIAFNRLAGELAAALSGIPSQPTDAVQQTTQNVATLPLPRPRPPEREAAATAISTDTRLALVIGNSKYQNLSKLSNPVNDARAVADVLRKMGYTTRLVTDATEQDIRREVRKFAGDSARADMALVFYAGHGGAGKRAKLRSSCGY
jgi:hypothetical protein